MPLCYLGADEKQITRVLQSARRRLNTSVNAEIQLRHLPWKR